KDENMENRPQKNNLINFVKGVAAFGVVLVHFQFPGVLGKVLCSLGVCGVVFFFLVSGYYAFDTDDESACRKLMKRFKRNLVITLIAVAVYAAYTVIEQLALGTFGEWLGNFKNPWLLPRMIILGDFEFIHGDPLWFMPALLYSYLILYLLHKAKISRYAYIMLPMLLLLRIGVETYTNSFGADWHLSGNFLVGGLPIVLTGHYIAYKKDNFINIPMYLTVSYSVFAAAMMFVTVNIPVFGVDVSQIFKVWCGVEIFLLTLRLPGKRGIPVIERIGEKYSLYIYLWHYLIGTLFLVILAKMNAPVWVKDWLLPVMVILASVLVSAAICAVKEKKTNR
ncbi:MAG: acyltransferase, partial [Clostridia bacterium]|nr:acyltransferase [Clostridia bacterium]